MWYFAMVKAPAESKATVKVSGNHLKYKELKKWKKKKKKVSVIRSRQNFSRKSLRKKYKIGEFAETDKKDTDKKDTEKSIKTKKN